MSESLEGAVASAVESTSDTLSAIVPIPWFFRGVSVTGAAVFMPARKMREYERAKLGAAGFTYGTWRARNNGSQRTVTGWAS